MYELTIPEKHQIAVQDKQITIIGYDELVKELDQLGEYLLSIEVTPENLADSRKLVAQVRKSYTELNAEKIAFKKEYLKPLETLEKQVSEIQRRTQNYENNVRRQINLLEEQERKKKEETIRGLFKKRLRAYGGNEIERIYSFEDFYDPKYANKSYPMNKVEKAMADFFENRREDLGALINFADTADLNRDTVVTKFLEGISVAETINYFNKLKQEKTEVKEALNKQKSKPKEEPPEPQMYFKVKESDYARVCELLSLGNIEFEVVELD